MVIELGRDIEEMLYNISNKKLYINEIGTYLSKDKIFNGKYKNLELSLSKEIMNAWDSALKNAIFYDYEKFVCKISEMLEEVKTFAGASPSVFSSADFWGDKQLVIKNSYNEGIISTYKDDPAIQKIKALLFENGTQESYRNILIAILKVYQEAIVMRAAHCIIGYLKEYGERPFTVTCDDNGIQINESQKTITSSQQLLEQNCLSNNNENDEVVSTEHMRFNYYYQLLKENPDFLELIENQMKKEFVKERLIREIGQDTPYSCSPPSKQDILDFFNIAKRKE